MKYQLASYGSRSYKKKNDKVGKEDKMLAVIYGILTFVFLILATGAAEGGSFILGLLFIGLFWLFARLAWYESGRRKKNRPH